MAERRFLLWMVVLDRIDGEPGGVSLQKSRNRKRSRMYRILFICWGNICRSPMAEFILKDIVAKRYIADEFVIESAATSTEARTDDEH